MLEEHTKEIVSNLSGIFFHPFSSDERRMNCVTLNRGVLIHLETSTAR